MGKVNHLIDVSDLRKVEKDLGEKLGGTTNVHCVYMLGCPTWAADLSCFDKEGYEGISLRGWGSTVADAAADLVRMHAEVTAPKVLRLRLV